MTIEKMVDLAIAEPGDILIYTIWYNNTGNGTAGVVWVNDTLPAEVSYVSDTSGVVPVVFGQDYSWMFLNVLPGDHSFTVTVQVDGTIIVDTLVINSATLEFQFENGLDGRPFPIGFSSSRLTKAEFADLITTVQEYGDRHGVEWSEPCPYEVRA